MSERRWPAGRPRILVTDAWLANAGDGAISLATDARIRRLAPGAAVLHAAYQADLVGGAYPQLDFVPPLDGLLGVVSDLPEMAGWGADRAEALVTGADAVLSQGGGFAMEHYGPSQRLRAWELVADSGLPLAFAAQSVSGWRSPRERAMLARAYGAAVAVGVRDADSKANVIELGADPERVVLAADEVFDLFAEPPPEGRDAEGIAAVLTMHPAIRRDGAVPPVPDLRERLVAVLERLVEIAGSEGVTLLSTQQGLGGLGRGLEDDAELAADLRQGLPAAVADRVTIAGGYLAPAAFAEVVSRHRALVTMRMHPAIIALSRGVPAMLISSAFKAAAVFDRVGLGDLVSTDLRPAEVARRVEAALSDGGLRGAALWEALADARRHAAVNDIVVRRLLVTAEKRGGLRR